MRTLLSLAAIIALAANVSFAATVTTASGYNEWLLATQKIVSSEVVTVTDNSKLGYSGVADKTVTTKEGKANGAYQSLVFVPGSGKLSLLSGGTTFEDQYWKATKDHKNWAGVGTGWFNADGTPVAVNGKWFYGGKTNGANYSNPDATGVDLSNPANQTTYLLNPGYGYKGLGAMGGSSAAYSFALTRPEATNGNNNLGFTISNSNSGSGALGRERDFGDLESFRTAALAAQGQTAATAEFTWVRIDFSKVTNASNTKINAATIAALDVASSSLAWRDGNNGYTIKQVAGTGTTLESASGIAAESVAYWQLGTALSVDNIGLWGTLNMAQSGNQITGASSNWQQFKIEFLTQKDATFTSESTGAFTYTADAGQVQALANLKGTVETAKGDFDSKNAAVTAASQALTAANTALSAANSSFADAKAAYDAAAEAFEAAKAAVDSFNADVEAYLSADFASYDEALAAYDALVAAQVDAFAAYDAAQAQAAAALAAYDAANAALAAAGTFAADAQAAYIAASDAQTAAALALLAAGSAYDDYLEYGRARQQGIDNTFATDAFDFGTVNGIDNAGSLYGDEFAYGGFAINDVATGFGAPQEASETPEPATLLILGLGLAGLGLARRRK